jgi:hypothetical protein
LEVDGEFYHGLIQLPNEHKHFNLMLDRKAKHDKKHEYIKNTCQERGYVGILSITDK